MVVRRLFKFKKQDYLENITLTNIQDKLYETGFSEEFTEEIMVRLEQRLNEQGEKQFQQWFSELHYQTPEEFKDESVAIEIYDNYSQLIEQRVKELEKETKLSWKEQTEDIMHLHEKARKVQLVIRDRLSGIALDLLD